MKKYIFLIFLFLTTAVFVFLSSHKFTESLGNNVQDRLVSRSYLLAHSHINRAQAYLVAGKTLNENRLLGQAGDFLNISAKNLKELDLPLVEGLLRSIDELQSEQLRLYNEQELGNDISREDLLKFIEKCEKVNLDIIEIENKYQENAFSNLLEIIEYFETSSLITFVIFIISCFVMGLMIYVKKQQEEHEKVLFEQRKIRSEIFYALNEIVFYVDQSSKILACNQSAAKLAKMNISELHGQFLKDILPTTSIQQGLYATTQTIQGIITKGESCSDATMLVSSDDGPYWYKLSSQPIISNPNSLEFTMIITLSDITQQIETNELLKRQSDQLTEAARMQSIGELAGGIAHEINNPLSIISSTAELLKSKSENVEQISAKNVYKTTSNIMRTVDRISKIVKGLLKLSRNEDQAFVKTTVFEVVTTAAEFVSILVKKAHVKLIIKENNFEEKLDCQSILLSQVLINLIKNSTDALESLEEKWIKISVEVSADYICFHVIDSGGGLSDEVAKKALQPYYTTKGIGKGTGLGLSISRKIAEQHGGDLFYNNNYSNTCFTLKVKKSHAKSINEDDFKDMIIDLKDVS